MNGVGPEWQGAREKNSAGLSERQDRVRPRGSPRVKTREVERVPAVGLARAMKETHLA